MRTVFTLMIVEIFFCCCSSSSHCKDACEFIVHNTDETPFSSYTATSPSVSGDTWSLTVVMDQDVKDNNTTFEITTQICLNSGVCDPPVVQQVTVEDLTHTTSLTPPEDHSYVNWRVKAMYEDDTTEYFPQGAWYTIWSSCYQDDGVYYGVDADGDSCAEIKADEGFLPGFTLVPALTAVGLAIALARRD